MRKSASIVIAAFLLFFQYAALAEPIKIGATLPLNGVSAVYGESMRRGVELAVKDINTAGGVHGRPLELHIEAFDFIDLKKVAAAAHKLIEIDHVQALLTAWSEDTEIVIPIATKAGIPVITIDAGAKGITERSPLLFRAAPSSEAFIRAEVEYAVRLGKKHAAVIADQSAYYVSIRDITSDLWRQHTGFYPLVEDVAPAERDFSSIIAKIRAGTYDVIFCEIEPAQLADLLQQAKTQNLNQLKFGDNEHDKLVANQAPPGATEGFIFPMYEPATKEFRAAYAAAYGEEPGVASDYAYDTVKLLAHSMSESGLTSAQIVSGLSAIKDFPGASGKITFLPNRDRADRPVLLKRIERGAVVPIE